MRIKSEQREKVRANQRKMVVSGMYLRKVLLPLMQKRGLSRKKDLR